MIPACGVAPSILTEPAYKSGLAPYIATVVAMLEIALKNSAGLSRGGSRFQLLKLQ
jgi:hypothetical protein